MSGISHNIGILVQGHNALTASLGAASRSMTDLRKSAEATALAINSLTPQDVNMDAIRQASRHLKDMGKQAMLAGAAVAGGLGLAVRESAVLEESLSNLSSVSTLPTDGSIKTLTEGMDAAKRVALDWSNNHVQAANEVTDSMYDLASAGLAVSEVNEVVTQTMALSTATRAKATDASAMMAKSLNTFGKQQMATMSIQERATTIMDAYAAVVKGAKTTLPELGSAMKTVAGSAANAGLTLQETASVVGLLQTKGMGAEQSGTALDAVLRQMPKAAQNLGIAVADANGKLLPMADILTQLSDRYAENGLSVSESAEIQKVFGDEAARAVKLLIGQESELRNLTQAAWQSGAAMNMVALQEDNLSAQSRIAWNNMKNLAVTIGDNLLPILKPMASMVGTAAKSLSAFSQAHPVLAQALTVLGATTSAMLALGGAALWTSGQLLLASATVEPYFTAIGARIAALSTRLIATAATAKATMVGMATQAGTTITGMYASMSVGLGALMTTIKAQALTAMTTVWTGITVGATAMWTSVTAAMTGVKASVLSTLATIQGASFASVFAAIQTVVVGMWGSIGVAATATGAAAKAAWAAITGPVGMVVLGIAAVVGAGYWLWKSFDENGQGLQRVWTVIKETFSGVVDSLMYGVGYLVGVFDVAWGKVKAYTMDVWPMIEQIISGVWLAIRAYTLPIASAIVAVVTTAWGALKTATIFVWDVIASTVKAGAMVMYHLVAGAWTAVSGVFKAGLQVLTGDFSGAWETIQGAFGGAWEHIKGMFGAFVGWFADLGTAFWDAGSGLIDAFLGGIIAGWNTLKSGFLEIWEEVRSYLPGSDAKQGPLSDLTASGRALPRTFAHGVAETSNTPVMETTRIVRQMNNVLQFPVARAANLPTQALEGTAPVVPIRESRIMPTVQRSSVSSSSQTTNQSKTVVFSKGSIQVDVTVQVANGQMDLTDFKDKMTDMLGQCVDELGVSNG